MSMESSSKRLTPMQWAEAEAKWATGEFTLDDLSNEFGVRPETLSRRFTKKGIKKGAASIGRELRETYIETVKSRAELTAEKIQSRREKFDSWGVAIGGLIMKEIGQAAKDNAPISTREDNIKTLVKAAQGIQSAWAISKDALNMDAFTDENDELPELAFTQLTEDQIREIRQAQESEDELGIGEFDDDDLDDLEEPEDEDDESVIEA